MRHPEKESVAACPRLLTKAEVLALLGVTYTTVFTWMREGQFPLSIELGPSGGRSTKIAWLADEVYAWIAARPRRKLTPTPIKPSTQPAQRRRAVDDLALLERTEEAGLFVQGEAPHLVEVMLQASKVRSDHNQLRVLLQDVIASSDQSGVGRIPRFAVEMKLGVVGEIPPPTVEANEI
jgi:predicted DNA-binding transcriptional regulator AlpA